MNLSPRSCPTYTKRAPAFLTYSPLGHGLLNGRFDAPADLSEGDWRRGLPRFSDEAMTANQPLVSAVHTIAKRHDASPGQVALAWLLHQGENVIPIPGTTNPRYLVENTAAVDLELTAAELSELDAMPVPVGTRE